MRHVISRKNDLSVVQERKSQLESLAVPASLHSNKKEAPEKHPLNLAAVTLEEEFQ